MELKTIVQTAITKKVGRDLQTVEAGKHLAIGQYAPEDFWLDVEVPAGEAWDVDISVSITVKQV